MMEVVEPAYSSLSELDTSSDSDWLDISSRAASEDNDSVASFYDSDRDDIYDRPASRRSLSSLTSSRSGVVEGWEGLIDDADEATPAVHPGPTLFGDADDDHERPASPEQDPDDEKVKAGLEQSMMSTLSSPRSNSLSNSQTSVVRSTRDLRLSFPDPLTSSNPTLHSSSYEDVSAPAPDEYTVDEGHPEAEHLSAPAPAVEDPGFASTPEVLPKTASQVQTPHIPSSINPDFFIVLYGLSSTSKDAIVDTLLTKWASAAGLVSSCTVLHATSVTSRVYIPKEGDEGDQTAHRLVSIIDKTDSSSIKPSDPSPPCPSLAIVLLPAMPSISLGVHTLYLPVVVPSPLTLLEASTDYLLDAEQQWESLGIPSEKLTSLSDWSTAVVDHEKLEATSSIQISNAFRPLLKLQKQGPKRMFSTNAILLAILSIFIGYIVKGTVNSGITPIPARPWEHARPALGNKSVATSAPVSISTLLPNSVMVPPSSKDMQISIVSSVTSVAAVTTAPRQVATSSAPPASTSAAAAHDIPSVDAPTTECACGCGMVTWSNGKILSTDLIVRPAASASALSSITKDHPHVTPSVGRGYTRRGSTGKGKGKATSLDVGGDASLYALSTRIAGSISEYFELDLKAILGVNQEDMQVLLDALQVLYNSIDRHRAIAVEKSRTNLNRLKVQVQAEVKYRNARAKAKAKELKEKGRQYLTSLREQVKTRADLAKEHAKVIKQNLKTREWRERKIQRAEARQLRRLKRWESKHFKRALRVY